MNQKTTVLLADDHGMFREGLRRLLEAEAGITIIGEAADGHSAVKMARELSPDVVCMDVSMPDLNGVEAARQITTNGSKTKVVALSSHSGATFVKEMLRAGATAYVLKESAFQELVLALRAVVANKVYLSPAVAGIVVDGFVHTGTSDVASAFDTLSPRERQILQLIAEGCATKEVATRLVLSTKTVETHRRNIMEKLGLDSVAKLTKYAIREGITSIET